VNVWCLGLCLVVAQIVSGQGQAKGLVLGQVFGFSNVYYQLCLVLCLAM
jgi:uncharacterized membrane protein YecN with MAPEG domain